MTEADIALEAAHAEVGACMAKIAKRFKPGVKITVLVRVPFIADGDLVVSDDDIDDAIAALQRMRAVPPVTKQASR